MQTRGPTSREGGGGRACPRAPRAWVSHRALAGHAPATLRVLAEVVTPCSHWNPLKAFGDSWVSPPKRWRSGTPDPGDPPAPGGSKRYPPRVGRSGGFDTWMKTGACPQVPAPPPPVSPAPPRKLGLSGFRLCGAARCVCAWAPRPPPSPGRPPDAFLAQKRLRGKVTCSLEQASR